MSIFLAVPPPQLQRLPSYALGATKAEQQQRQKQQQHQQEQQQQQLPVPEDLVRYLLVDPRVYEALSADKGCVPITDKEELAGFETYLVEQWAVDRKLNAAITSYTGNMEHKIFVSVIGLPRDSATWTEDVRSYFDGMVRLHSRPKETELGLIFVTNLSSFPSNLNLVPVPAGDIRSAAQLFYVNQDLRRVGCGGRQVLAICSPSDAGEAKFRQIFRAHERVPLNYALLEMVTMIQIVLVYCDLLEPVYVDGLLCNKTLASIRAWWKQSGQLRFGIRGPASDGVLSPTTVAAIISFVTGIRNRLSTLNYKPPKDPFDADEFVLCIKAFQKHEHLPKTMRLDNATISRIYQLTDKTSNTADFIGMVKTTMKEVSGKQVQAVADSETLDIDRLVPNLQGRRARYLWTGKGHPRPLDRCGHSDLTGIPLSSLSPSEFNTVESRRGIIKPPGGAIVTKIRNLPNRRPLGTSGSIGGGSESLDDAEDSVRGRMRKYLTPLDPVKSRATRASFGSSDDNESDMELVGHSSVDRSTGIDELCSGERSHISGSGDRQFDADRCAAIRRCPITRSYSYVCPETVSHANDDDDDDDDDDDGEFSNLKRSNSFSVVSEAVLGWDFDFPVDKVAQIYHSTKRRQYCLEREMQQARISAAEYHSKLQMAGKSVSVNKEVLGKMKFQLQSVARKEHQLKSDIQRAELVASRLKYEIRVLESKIHDVEESVDSFQAKVCDVERRAQKSCPCSLRPIVSSVNSVSNSHGAVSSFINSILSYFASISSYSAHASSAAK